MFESTSTVEDEVTIPSFHSPRLKTQNFQNIIDKRKKNPNQIGLPAKLIFKIFTFLSPLDIETGQKVCWYWNQVINQTNLWKIEYFNTWNSSTFFFKYLKKKLNLHEVSFQMKELFLYKRYQHELYTRGKVNLLKQYTELDVKLLLLPPTVFQQIKKSNEWDFVDDFDNLDSDIAEDDEVRLHTPVVDQTSNEIELLNYENSTVDDEGNTWIDSSFQIEEVVLKDKKVLVHLNKYQKLKEKFFIKRSIYDLMIYSQYSAQRIHKYCETTQWISKINKCSSEQNDVNFLKGTPNIFPKYGSKSKNIWQPKKDDQDRFLELSFDQAVYLTKISIYETLNPGSVSKIYSWNDQESNFILIYDKIDSNESEIDDLQNSRIFQPPLKKTKFKTNIIRIEFLKNDKTIQVDSVNIQGIVEKSNLNRFSIHSEFIDTIEQQKHVIHVPYTNPVISPFDYNQQYNYLIFNEIESQKYHTTKKLTNVSLNSKELGKIQFRAKYLNDEILKIKIISNFAYVLIKQIKIPGAYVLNVWDLSTGTLEKTFEFKECSGYDNIVNWEITNDVICCFRENEIFVYDISSNEVEQWKHRSKIQLDNNVNHISIKEECNLTLNILSVCTSNSELIIWDIFLCKILHQIKLPEPGTCSSILSFGSLIAVSSLYSSTIFIFNTLDGMLIREIESNNIPNLIGEKQISFDDEMMTFFTKGTNEYYLHKFSLDTNLKLKVNLTEEVKQENCLIL